jgi:hypothetical protein
MRPLLLTALLLASSSVLAGKPPAGKAACERVTRTVEVLGWTQDGTAFAWHETEKQLATNDSFESAQVVTTLGAHLEFALKLPKEMKDTPPEYKTADAWKAWKTAHPFAKPSTSLTSPTEKTSTLKVLLGTKPMTPRGNEFLDPRPSTPPENFWLGVTSTHDIEPRLWKPDVKAEGCARVAGYWSPDGAFVAWLTGSVKETCSDDRGCSPKCCQDPQALLLRAK